MLSLAELRGPTQPPHEEVKIMAIRDTYKYDFKQGNKILHSGVTNDLERREDQHQLRWPSGHISQVGNRTTREAAEEWEESKHKTITPKRG